MKESLKGYMTSLPIHGSRFPHRVQNILLRDYCTRFGYEYLFSMIEVSVRNGHHVLMNMIEESSNNGILFFSVAMLPQDFVIRKKSIRHIGSRKKSSLLFGTTFYVWKR